jgi:hypothetical protein
MESNELGPEDVVLVDTNLFVSVGGVNHPKFRKLREFAERRQPTLLVPQRVRQELSTMHIADRVERAANEGWAELIDPPSPTDSDAVEAMDFVRREIARQTGVEEHRVEKADTVFAGLALELLREGNPRVAILTDDRIAAAAIERVVEEQGYSGSVLVLRRDDVIDDDGDVRVI